jgi:uncharacterized membrane protein YwzB
MNGKLILYLVITPLVIWSLDSLNINVLFKKNKYMEAGVIYILIGIAISYLAVNFLYDFFELSSYY